MSWRACCGRASRARERPARCWSGLRPGFGGIPDQLHGSAGLSLRTHGVRAHRIDSRWLDGADLSRTSRTTTDRARPSARDSAALSHSLRFARPISTSRRLRSPCSRSAWSAFRVLPGRTAGAGWIHQGLPAHVPSSGAGHWEFVGAARVVTELSVECVAQVADGSLLRGRETSPVVDRIAALGCGSDWQPPHWRGDVGHDGAEAYVWRGQARALRWSRAGCRAQTASAAGQWPDPGTSERRGWSLPP